MRPIPSSFAILVALTVLAACGTKTPLTKPQPPQPAIAATPAPAPAFDNTNKATAEPGQ